MRNTIIGIVIGVVIGVVFGTTVIAPKLVSNSPSTQLKLLSATSNKTANVSIIKDTDKKPILPKAVQAVQVVKAVQAEVAIAAGPLVPKQSSNPVVRWKMASAYGSTLPQLGTLGKRLEKRIWHVSGGRIEIKFYEPGTLVPPFEMFNAVAAGAIDAAFSTPGYWERRIPALQLFSAVPFGPSAGEYLAWIEFGGGKEIFQKIYAKHGIHTIHCGLTAPSGSGWFRKPVRTVQDFDGLKMRFTGLGAKVMQKLGVETKALKEGDIFIALESGSIDGVQYSMPSIDAKLGFHEMAKHYYLPGWHQPATLIELMINAERWNTLSTTAKAQIETVCGDNVRFGLAVGEAGQFSALKSIHAKGVKIHRWTPEIMAALKGAWKKVADEESAANKQFKKVWKSLSNFRQDYAIWRELGHP